MMTPATVRKLEALKKIALNGSEVTHYDYATLYAHNKGIIPTWATLKKHNLLKYNRTSLRIVKGYNGNLEAVNANVYNYNL